MTYEESESELPAIPEGRNCARIMGVKRDLFVEFEFFAGDATLSVELILPIMAFVEFCSVNDVLMIDPQDKTVGIAYEKLCWRHSVKPGRPDIVLAR